MLAYTHVAVSVSGVVVGLLLAALIYVVGHFAARRTGEGAFLAVAAIVAVLVFIVSAFDFYGS